MKEEVWKNPGAEHSLDEAETPLWFWNDKLETAELQRQLKLMTDTGVTSINPHARTNGGEGYIGGYLDEQWFRNIRTVLDYKKEHGEKMWLYDEIDWPAGTCNQTITLDEKNREQYVEIRAIRIPAGEHFRAQCLTFEEDGLFGLTKDSEFSHVPLNIHIVDAESGKPYDVTQFMSDLMFGPELEFCADRDAVAYITQIRVDAYEYGGNEQVNYLDANATKAFLHSTYDRYAEEIGEVFGREVTTIFNDETRMCHAIPWSRSFAEAFQEKNGYDIRQELYRVILPGRENGRIRCDYYDMVADQYQQNYFGEIHRWCRQHHIKLFAHLLGEETLFGHARYSGDYMRQNREQDVAGADYLGKGIGSLNIKFTSCAAHSYGKKQTAVEVFAGCGWDLTFDEYTRMVTWMYQMGMQTIINHGFFYSDRGNRKNDWPPSQFFQWKYWDRQKEGNAMIRRLQYALSGGVNEADVLVYVPTETMWLHYLPDQNYTHGFFRGAYLRDDEAVRTDREFQLALNGLLSHNLDFDLLHMDALENFTVSYEESRQGKQKAVIRNTASGQKFYTLVLPMTELLPLKAAELCRAFAEAGGRIICFGRIPDVGRKPSEDDAVRKIMQELAASRALEVIPADEKERFYRTVSEAVPHPVRITKGTAETVNFHPAYPGYLIDPYMHGGEDITGVMFNRYIGPDDQRRILFMNYGTEHEESIEVYVERSRENGSLTVWDTLSGEIHPAEVVSEESSSAVIRLMLPCFHGLIVTA